MKTMPQVKLTQNELVLIDTFRRIRSWHSKFVVFVLASSLADGAMTPNADRKKNLRDVYPEFR